jgi:hypothetical protein
MVQSNYLYIKDLQVVADQFRESMKKNRQKPAAGFNPLYDHNHVISDWFPYKSDIAAHG